MMSEADVQILQSGTEADLDAMLKRFNAAVSEHILSLFLAIRRPIDGVFIVNRCTICSFGLCPVEVSVC